MIRAILTASILLGLGAGTAMAQNVTWKSGVGSGDANGFAAWRGRPLGLATGLGALGQLVQHAELHERR